MAAHPPPPLPRRLLAPMLDRIGATGSLLCAIHCAVLPVLIVALPSLGLAAWLGHGFELGFVAFATLLGLYSLVRSYRRHRFIGALRLLVPGLALLWAGAFYEPLHDALVPHAITMTLGGTLVGLAHLVNLRLQSLHDATCCAP